MNDGTTVRGAAATVAAALRVVHVITTLTTGGAERQLELLVGLSRNETATIALYEGGAVADAMRARGDRVEVLGMQGWRKAAAVARLAAALRRYRPDVVHVHLLSAQLWALPAARLARVPVVVSSEHSLMDDTIEGRPLTPALLALYRGLERLATHTVAVSATTAARLAHRGVDPARVTVVDNGIDFTALAFDPVARARVRAELGIGDGTLVIGAVGRLDPVKRMHQVLRAAAPRLHSTDAVLVVAGTGSLLPSLQRLTDELAVADRVRWLGARPDIPAVLSAMDVMLSASRDETFGMAVVEGLGAGLPVAYVECPALTELATPVAAAVQVAEHADEDEDEDEDEQVTALAQGLDAIVRLAPPPGGGGGGRSPVDPLLAQRYGAHAAAERIDALYARLLDSVHHTWWGRRCGSPRRDGRARRAEARPDG